MRVPEALFLSTLLMLAGCSSPENPSTSILVRDSAGTRIVENSLAAMDSAAEWSLSPSPVLQIGSLDGPEPFQFHRVAGAILNEGVIWVLDGGSSELRGFHTDGTHLRTVGRNGEGPGEFVYPAELGALGPDTLLVWDESQRRISLLDQSGTFLRSVSILSNFRNPSFISAFEDGSFLLSDLRVAFPTTHVVEESPLYLLRFDSEGLLTDSLGVFPWLRVKRIEEPLDIAPIAFSPVTFVAGDRGTFWVGTGEELEIQERTPDGRVVQILRWGAPDRTVRREDVDAMFSKHLEEARTEDARRRISKRRDQVPSADKFPALADLVVDRVGRVWVKEFQRSGAEGVGRWMVFNRSGEIKARISLGTGFWPLDFGEDYVLGYTRGEFDEEYIVLFDIVEEEH